MLNAIFFIKNHVKGIIYIHSLGFLPSFLKIYNFARIKIIALWKSILWMTVIFNSVMVLLITNTTDLMLWWAVILSGTILTKKHIIKL